MVTVNPVPSAHSSFTQRTICEGEEIQLQASGGTTYQWSPFDHLSSADIPDPMASPLTNTTYQVKVFNQFGCMDTANVTVGVTSSPQADAGPDLSIIEGTSAQLMAHATGQNVSYSWSPAMYLDNPFLLQPVVTPLRDTAYILTVVSNVGCGIATDTVRVLVYKDVFVPTAFSPNNDGVNDTWNIPALAAYPHFELTVFNRYGNIVFQNKHSNKPWDGRYRGEPQPSGIYVYMIDLKDGSAILKGTLMLVR
jgi:gliding motility-associated-like protein